VQATIIGWRSRLAQEKGTGANESLAQDYKLISMTLLMAQRLLEHCTLPVDAGTPTKDGEAGSAA
jgi:hypothetical protein